MIVAIGLGLAIFPSQGCVALLRRDESRKQH